MDAMSEKEEEATTIDSLPDEILCLVFAHAHLGTLVVSRAVCRRWRQALAEPHHACTSPAAASLARPFLRGDYNDFIQGAVKWGHVHVIRWALANGCAWSERHYFMDAARRGRLELLQELHALAGPWKVWAKELYAVAAKAGDLDMLRWLLDSDCPRDERACAAAAGSLASREDARLMPQELAELLEWPRPRPPGPLELLQWLRAKDFPWDVSTCNRALRHNNKQALEWAHANGCPWDKTTCALAAELGHLETLQWLRAEGCSWDVSTARAAAVGGHLEVLQWARANGCPWDARTCAAAAEGGNLALLQWLRANGCPWDDATWTYADDWGGPEILAWVQANGCPAPPLLFPSSKAHGFRQAWRWA